MISFARQYGISANLQRNKEHDAYTQLFLQPGQLLAIVNGRSTFEFRQRVQKWKGMKMKADCILERHRMSPFYQPNDLSAYGAMIGTGESMTATHLQRQVQEFFPRSATSPLK